MACSDSIRALEAAIDAVYSGAATLADAERRNRALRVRDDPEALCARGRYHTLLFHWKMTRGELDGDVPRAAIALLRAAAARAPDDPHVQASLADAALARAWSGGALLQAVMV